MRLGIRCHDLGRYTLEDLAKEVNKNGIKSVQLVMKKAITEFEVEKGSLTPGLARHIKQTLNKYDVEVSILGSYINMAHPNEREVQELLEWFKAHIRFARDLGCSIVGTETGCPNKEYAYTPENNTEKSFQTFIKSLKVLVEEAEKFGVIVGIEGVTKHIINTPEKMKRVLDTVQSNNLQVIFDPINLIEESNYEKQDEIITKSFELFGDRIVLVHAKDFVYEDGKIKQVTIGKGQFNHKLLLSILKEKKPHIDVILEDTTPDDVLESVEFLKELYNQI